MARRQNVTATASTRHDGAITVNLMSSLDSGSGVIACGHLSVASAELLIEQLRAAIDGQPKEAAPGEFDGPLILKGGA